MAISGDDIMGVAIIIVVVFGVICYMFAFSKFQEENKILIDEACEELNLTGGFGNYCFNGTIDRTTGQEEKYYFTQKELQKILKRE